MAEEKTAGAKAAVEAGRSVEAPPVAKRSVPRVPLPVVIAILAIALVVEAVFLYVIMSTFFKDKGHSFDEKQVEYLDLGDFRRDVKDNAGFGTDTLSFKVNASVNPKFGNVDELKKEFSKRKVEYQSEARRAINLVTDKDFSDMVREGGPRLNELVDKLCYHIKQRLNQFIGASNTGEQAVKDVIINW